MKCVAVVAAAVVVTALDVTALDVADMDVGLNITRFCLIVNTE